MANRAILYATAPVGGFLSGKVPANQKGLGTATFKNPGGGEEYNLVQYGGTMSWIPYIISGPFYEGDIILGLLGFVLHVTGWVMAFIADLIVKSKLTDGKDKLMEDYWMVSIISLCIGLGLITFLTVAAVCMGCCNLSGAWRTHDSTPGAPQQLSLSFGPKSVSPGMIGLMTGGVTVSAIFTFLILTHAEGLWEAHDFQVDKAGDFILHNVTGDKMLETDNTRQGETYRNWVIVSLIAKVYVLHFLSANLNWVQGGSPTQ